MLIALALAAVPTPPACPIERAVYRLRGAPTGRTLWYRPATLAGGAEKARQEAMPTGFFEPAGCGGPPR
jgi:hypothetical protein